MSKLDGYMDVWMYRQDECINVQIRWMYRLGGCMDVQTKQILNLQTKWMYWMYRLDECMNVQIRRI